MSTSLLEDNGYFGVKPGRLLSVSGNVISEDGGDRCALAIDGKAVAMGDLAATEVPEGAEVSVGDGADVTEPHEEQTVPLAPGIQMESGGAVQYVSQWGAPGSKLVWKGLKSGEVVDKEVRASRRRTWWSPRGACAPRGGKYMALTFDDGPSKVHAADPRHPQGEGRAGDLLQPGKPGGALRQGREARGRGGPRAREPHQRPPVPAGAGRGRAAGRDNLGAGRHRGRIGRPAR